MGDPRGNDPSPVRMRRATWRIRDLARIDPGEDLRTDVLIVGGGPAGLTVAQGLSGSGRDVLVLESGGLEETSAAEALNTVHTPSDSWTEPQKVRRRAHHGAQARNWDHDRQNYGVRCRVLGGSTHSWAGKSAAFDDVDFETRPWVPDSGWPITLKDLQDPLERAAATLNLGPNCYDDALWARMNRKAPLPSPDPQVLGSYFWQFSRSRLAPIEVMQFGHEFRKTQPDTCRVVTQATVLDVLCAPGGRAVKGVRVADVQGATRTIRAAHVVLAASAIENARLLLNSRETQACGLGNETGNVGRYLMDHPGAMLARFDQNDVLPMSKTFGFFGLRSGRTTSMYMRGLAPTAELQHREELLNCAVFMSREHAADDPLPALKRIVTGQSAHVLKDLGKAARSPGIVTKGLARMAAQHPRFPTAITRFAVDQIVRFRPDFTAEEYLSGGMPHKLVGLPVQGICEQAPDAHNRVALSDRTDRFGQPLPLVHWRVGARELRTLARLGEIVVQEFANAGLPVPQLEPWVRDPQRQGAAIIDMAHSCGTTRMADDPGKGVVDANCRVHGLANLYVAGSSVFPTSGHANPTLMIVALSHRLADHLSGSA